MRKSFHQACFNGSQADWDRAIDYLSAQGEARMVTTITKAMAKQLKPKRPGGGSNFDWTGEFGVRFRDGSIAKMDAMIADWELQP